MTWISNRSLLSLGLLALLTALQCQLWTGQGGLQDIWRLRSAIAEASFENVKLTEQNAILAADVADLKAGDEAVAEHAREELGMVAQGEKFYQIVE